MLDYNRGNAKYDDPIGNHSPRPSGPKPEHEKENEKPTLVAPPPQSHQGKNQGGHPVESCFMTSGKQSTQARISDYFRPPVRSHAIHDQGGLETAHQRDGRGTSSRVDSDSARDAVSGAERRDLTWPEDPEPTLGGNESCFQEKDRIAEVHSRAPGTQDHRQRNGGSLTDHGSPKDHGDDTTTGIRQDGVWKTCQQDIPGGPRVRPVICGLVPPNQSRRGDMLADEEIPQVGDTTSSHSRECPRELHPEEDSAIPGEDPGELQPEEEHDLTRSTRLQQARSRLSTIQRHRGILHSHSHGHLSDSSRRRGTPQRPGCPDPRAGASEGHGPQEHIQERGSQDPEDGGIISNPDVKNSEPGANEKSGTGRGIEYLSEHAKKDILFGFCRGFEEDWNLVAFGGRLRLLEVCCDPESELSHACEKTFGPGSAQRLSHLNGGDLETTAGEEFVCSVIREKRPGLVWISPECGPYSPMQNLNQRTEQQKKQLQEKRDRAKRQYEATCRIGEFCHQEGIPFVIELSERCQGWQLPMFARLQNKVRCFSGVCKGCQVGLRNEKGELLGKGWRLMGSCRGLINHMSLRCTGNHVHGQCEGHNRCRSTAFYTSEFCKRVVQSIKTDNLCGKVVRELQDGTNIHGDMNHGILVHENGNEEKTRNHDFECWVMSQEQRTKPFRPCDESTLPPVTAVKNT